MQRLSDQKIRLSSDAYELVDKHIRKLDDDAAKLRASLRQKFVDATGRITTDGGCLIFFSFKVQTNYYFYA